MADLCISTQTRRLAITEKEVRVWIGIWILVWIQIRVLMRVRVGVLVWIGIKVRVHVWVRIQVQVEVKSGVWIPGQGYDQSPDLVSGPASLHQDQRSQVRVMGRDLIQVGSGSRSESRSNPDMDADPDAWCFLCNS